MQKSSLILLDCTLRDGGYYNSWDFSTELINDYLQVMSSISTNYVELGFRMFDTEDFRGACAYTTDHFINHLTIPDGLKIGVMVDASEIESYKEGRVLALSKLFINASKSPVSLVRIATHYSQFNEALLSCRWLKEKGYEVGINLMQIASCSEKEIEIFAHAVDSKFVDVLYFADSMGSMHPDKVSKIITSLRKGWDGPIGIHTHDNMGQALANSIKAIDDGVTWVDSTITGMGRGAGNVQTEYLVIELAERRKIPLNIISLLSIIDKYFKPLKLEYGWGVNTYYFLAGKNGIHPSFVQKMLSDSRYDHEDLIAVLEHLRTHGGKKFSIQAIEFARNFYKGEPLGNWSPVDLIEGREVLILGAGPSAKLHRYALEEYIAVKRPIVIALNAQVTVREELIDLRAASHPIRLLADYQLHLSHPQPLVAPASLLPESLRISLKGKELLDFSVAIEKDTFSFEKSHCVLPSSLVIGYALAIATSGHTSRILLAGFDGYPSDDPRASEMEALLSGYQQTPDSASLLAVTPSRYNIPITSIYAML